MVRRCYIVPLSGSQEDAQLNAERARIGNIFDTTRQKVIITRNTDAGESTIVVMSGIETFADIDDSANENLKIETSASAPIKINGKAAVADSDWVDYSSTSMVTGWSSYTEKILRYKTVGKIQFWFYSLSGTSNSTSASFTIPNASASALTIAKLIDYTYDNGSYQTSPGNLILGGSATTVNLYKAGITLWTNSGTKTCSGQFFIELP